MQVCSQQPEAKAQRKQIPLRLFLCPSLPLTSSAFRVSGFFFLRSTSAWAGSSYSPPSPAPSMKSRTRSWRETPRASARSSSTSSGLPSTTSTGSVLNHHAGTETRRGVCRWSAAQSQTAVWIRSAAKTHAVTWDGNVDRKVMCRWRYNLTFGKYVAESYMRQFSHVTLSEMVNTCISLLHAESHVCLLCIQSDSTKQRSEGENMAFLGHAAWGVFNGKPLTIR